MKANEEDYRREIHIIVDQIVSLERMKRVYSYVNRVYQIQSEEKEEDVSTTFS